MLSGKRLPKQSAGNFASRLLRNEPQGFAIDATLGHTLGPAYVGGPYGGTVSVKDPTLANNLYNVPLDSSNLTQSGTSGKMVLWNSSPYLRWAPFNSVSQSQAFDNAEWTKTNSTITANNTTAPDGTSTADKFVEASDSSQIHTIKNGTATTAGGAFSWTISVYAKENGRRLVIIADNVTGASGVYAVFDLAGGQVGVTSTAFGSGWTAIGSPTITSAGSGWYRCEFAFSTTDASIYHQMTADNATGTSALSQQYNGNGTAGFWIWGAQLNRGIIATPHLATTASGRVGIAQEYDTAAGQYGILIEPAATNLALRSEDFTNASWSNLGSTDSGDTTTAPDGSTTADTVIEDTGNTRHIMYQQVGGASVTTFSVFVKAKERTFAGVSIMTGDTLNAYGVVVDLSTGAVTSTGTLGSPTSTGSSVTAVGGGWYRVSVTIDPAALGGTYCSVGTSNSGTPAFAFAQPTFTGDGSSGIYIWGAQSEYSSVATSYIPTLGSTVTRAVDKIEALVSTFPTPLTNYTSYFDFKPVGLQAGATTYVYEIGCGTNSSVRTANYANSGSVFQFCQNIGTQCNTSLGSVSVGTRYQISTAYKANDFDGSLDGAAVSSDSVGSMPSGGTPGWPNRISLCGSADIGYTEVGSYRIYRMVIVPRQVETDGVNLASWRYNF